MPPGASSEPRGLIAQLSRFSCSRAGKCISKFKDDGSLSKFKVPDTGNFWVKIRLQLGEKRPSTK